MLVEVQKSEILSRVSLFSSLKEDSEALNALVDIMSYQEFEAGSVLIAEGELGDQFFVLIEGSVSVFKSTPDGDSYKVVILKSEMTPAVGEGGLIEAEPRSATVKCDMACKCLVLTRQKFHMFCAEHPKWAVPILMKIATTLIGRLRQTSNDLMLLHKALMNEIRG